MIKIYFLISLFFILISNQRIFPADHSIKEAYKLFEEENYQELIQYLLLWNDNNHTHDSLLLLGISFLYSGQYKQAIESIVRSEKLLDEAIVKTPEKAFFFKKRKIKILYYLSTAYQKNGDLDSALEKSLELLKDEPNNTIILSNIGFIYFKKNDLNKSEYFYKKSYKINPNFSSALSGLAKIYEKKNDLNQAISLYKRLIELNPSYTSYYIELSKIFLQKKDLYSHKYFLSKAYFLSGNYNQVLEVIYTIKDFRKNKELYQILISSLIDLKNFEEAEKEILKSIKLYKKNLFFKLNLATVFYIKKSYKESLKIVEELIKQDPNQKDFFILAGHIHFQEKNHEKAIYFYEKVIDLNEKDIYTREQLAQIYRLDNNKDMEYFHQALVYFFLKDFKQARDIFSWINENQFEKIKNYYYYRGMISMFNNKNLDALNSFEKLLQNIDLPLLKNKFFDSTCRKLATLYKKMNLNDKKDKLIEKIKQMMKKYPEYESKLKILIHKMNQ